MNWIEAATTIAVALIGIAFVGPIRTGWTLSIHRANQLTDLRGKLLQGSNVNKDLVEKVDVLIAASLKSAYARGPVQAKVRSEGAKAEGKSARWIRVGILVILCGVIIVSALKLMDALFGWGLAVFEDQELYPNLMVGAFSFSFIYAVVMAFRQAKSKAASLESF